MAAGAATRNLKLGTGICLVIERDTINTAKEAASVDFLTNGRFLFGIGGGWNVEEMEHHGAAFKTRFKKLREQVLAMKEIWTRDEAEFHGEFVNFDKLWCWPKPVQRPHPPVLLGGETAWTLQRVVDFCDGWFPRARDPQLTLSAMEELRKRAEQAGRDMRTISTSVFGVPDDQAALERYQAAGFTRAILRLPSEGRETVLPMLDQWTKFV